VNHNVTEIQMSGDERFLAYCGSTATLHLIDFNDRLLRTRNIYLG